MKEKLLSWLLAGSMIAVWLAVAAAVYATVTGRHDAGITAGMVGLVAAVTAFLIECVKPQV